MGPRIVLPLMLSLAACAPGPQIAARAPARPAACTGPEWRALDFWAGEWIGEWETPAGVKASGRNRISKDEFGRCVIVERFLADDGSLKGLSVSTYAARLGTWRQTWVDDQGGYFDLTGGPVTGQDHIFELTTVRATPSAPELRMIWQDVTPDSFVWRWQRRDGNAWTDQWVIRYRAARR